MIRLGKIRFANCDFPYYGMEHGHTPSQEIAITEGHPVELAGKIANNELDISPISSRMYPEIGEVLILPHLSITSNDFTKSVLVCANSNMELEDLEGRTLYITDISASSATLIKIILGLKGINVNIKTCGAGMPGLKQGEAALLIGDSALQAVGKYQVIADLGNVWKNLTGKKMVYAVWVVRKDYAQNYPEKVEYTADCLLKSKEYAYNHIDEIAKAISRSKGISEGFMNEYLHTLNYDFDTESVESLELYFNYAKQFGIMKKEAPLAFFRR
jgi:chorismate dehydratase